MRKNIIENDVICPRLNNLIISGVPIKENENFQETFNSISAQIRFESTPEAALLRFESTGQERCIVVKFASQYHKRQFFLNNLYQALSLSTSNFPCYEAIKRRIYIQHQKSVSKQQRAVQLKRIINKRRPFCRGIIV